MLYIEDIVNIEWKLLFDTAVNHDLAQIVAFRHANIFRKLTYRIYGVLLLTLWNIDKVITMWSHIYIYSQVSMQMHAYMNIYTKTELARIEI